MKQLRDYKCKYCGHVEELLSDREVIDCEKCGGISVKQTTFSKAKPIFKGKGFYETDYK
jgi:predicted nucleic acid-binding Zn ribbon protein